MFFGLQNFLRDKFGKWASNGSCVEDMENFKAIVSKCIERFVPHIILRKNRDSGYYNKEVKRIKIKVRKAYNIRKLGEHHPEDLKLLPKQLHSAKKGAQETFLDQY